eukprot:SAG22_NODE_2767_length_2227_cov_5.456767_1_plen_76_part_00
MGKQRRGVRAVGGDHELDQKLRSQRSRQDWKEEVEDIFEDTHPWLRCDKLSNVVLWASALTLLYWVLSGRVGYLG